MSTDPIDDVAAESNTTHEPSGALRRVALATMIVAVGLLLVTVVTRPSDDEGSASTTASDPPGDADRPVRSATPTPLATSTPTPNPFAVTTDDETLTIDRLWSPAPGTARAEGTSDVDRFEVPVTTDGVHVGTVELVAIDGRFEVDITDLEPGPQELCLDTACQRVLVADPAEEDEETILEHIDEARDRVEARFDLDVLIPGWTIEVGGPNSSFGGTADPLTRTIAINANSGRSVDDYEVTLLHEVGHAVDFVWMSPEQREEFGALRNHPPDLVWGPVDPAATGDDRWRNRAEDFAEVFVAWVLENDHRIMSEVVAPQPSDDDLRAFCELLAIGSLDCR